MLAAKISLLVVYAVLAAVAVAAAGGIAGNVAAGVLVLIAVAHTIEMAVYYKRCQELGGAMAAHMLKLFLFGFLYAWEL